MNKPVSKTPSEEEILRSENESLRARLDEAEQTLNAIHQGTVDAFVVTGPHGDNVFTLAGSEHNYRLLVESIGEGALTATNDGTILYCNAKFAAMVNQPEETIVGRRITDFIGSEERACLETLLRASTSELRKREVPLLRAGGKELSTQVSIGPLDADGLTGISVIITDLTDTIMAAKLHTVNQELEEKACDLVRSNAELGRFAYVASHDLKEPLRVIRTHLQLLQKKLGLPVGSVEREHMTFVMEAAARMYDLIDDLLGYARIGVVKEEPTRLDLNGVVGEAMTVLSSIITETRSEITVGKLPAVWAFPSQMIQLFQNLLSNAIKFRGGNLPKIKVSAETTRGECIVSVKDNGIGIAPEYSSRVFEVFQRLHSTSDYPGTGIGLAICAKIVEQHGGKIWVESQPGEGANFRFTLPMSEEQG